MDNNNNAYGSAYAPYGHAQAQVQSQNPANLQNLIGSVGNGQQQQQHQQQQQQQPQHQSHPSQQSLASFGSLSAQGHLPGLPSHTTLPPLQAHNGNYSQFHSMSYGHPGSQSHTPTTPHTPVSLSLPANNANGFSSHASHASPTNANPGSMLPPAFPSGAFSTSQPMMYSQSPTTTSAPSASSTGLPTLRPMPSSGTNANTSGHGLPSLPTSHQIGNIGQQSAFLQNEEAPTHVVGSQGRRGILPSAPGRPNATAPGSAQATKSMIPQKDEHGKFPCPHCNKTYLHAKHLKRHLLRHTGDRPYMCHLCKDTFSRSDILKRHFQKCSLRRGNPTGANHLAHQRRNTATGNRLSISQQDGPIGLAGLPDVAGQSPYSAGVVTDSPTVTGEISARSSRANSLISPTAPNNRNNIAGLGILASNGSTSEQMVTSGGYQPGMNAYAVQSHANGTHLPSSYSFGQQQMNGNLFNNHPAAQQQQQQQQPQAMPFLGQQSSRFDHSQNNSNSHSHPHSQPPMQPGVDGAAPNSNNNNFDWTRMFTQGGQDGFMNSHPANASSQGNDNTNNNHNNNNPNHGNGGNLKHEGDVKPTFHLPSEVKPGFPMQTDFHNEAFLGNVYSQQAAAAAVGVDEHVAGTQSFPNWNLEDPLQAKIDLLREHCFPADVPAIRSHPAADVMMEYLTIDWVKHFIEHYTSFQGHWPLLHMATFRVMDASNNLLLAMLCVGAIYSPTPTRCPIQKVRQMMVFVKETIHRTSHVYRSVAAGQLHGLGTIRADVEELQALSIMQTIFTWHGDPAQRNAARADFLLLVKATKALDLLQAAPPGHYAHSPLHATRSSHANQFDPSRWNWHAWVEQEKRNRLLYQVWVTDAAMVIYFNTLPQFDPFEIRIMLPCDDAAWDANSAQECVNALGLNGPHAQAANLNGTRRPIQPNLRDALRLLLEPSPVAMVQNGATNVYAKFLLVHALILRVISGHRASLQPDGQAQGYTMGINGSLPATPLSQSDWLEQHGGSRSGSISGNNSGRATPTDPSSSSHHGNPTPTTAPTSTTNTNTTSTPTTTSQPSSTHLLTASQQEKKRMASALEKWKTHWDTDMSLQYPPQQFPQKRFGFSRDAVHFYYLARIFLTNQTPLDFAKPADLRFKQVMSLLKRIKSMVVGDHESNGLAEIVGSVGDIDMQYGLDSLTLDMTLLFTRYDSRLDSPVARVQTGVL